MQFGFHLINDDDIPYEQELLSDPDSLSNWLRYYRYKSNKQNVSVVEKTFILERAVIQLPRSYKLWMIYLRLRTHHVRNVNYSRFRSQYEQVNALFEKSLVLLHKFPVIWLEYLQFLMLQPDITKIRRKFNEALRALPLIQHKRLWDLILPFSQQIGGKFGVNIYMKYLQYDPSKLELVNEKLLEFGDLEQANKLFMRVLQDPKPTEKAPLDLWLEYSDLLIKQRTSKSVNSNQFDLFFDNFIRAGLVKFPDQVGKLYVKLATYYIKRNNYERSRSVFEQGITSSMTIRDFIMIFDSYLEFEEQTINKSLGKIQSMEDGGEIIDDDLNSELDLKMARFEKLMDRRPFLLNDVLLKQDSNNVETWLNRVDLFAEDDLEGRLKTYVKGITTIEPLKTRGLQKLWLNYSKVYEENGDLTTTRNILDKAVKVPFKNANDLVEIWLEWAEIELRHDEFDRSLNILATALTIPSNTSTIDYFDDQVSAQARVHKSIKLWSFYLDLIESLGEVKETTEIYEKVFSLKIATPLTVINYANFLEDNKYFEESFKIYERGISIFQYPTAFEIWNIYLTKAIKRQLSMERMRDLFEQALENCPSNLSKAIYLLYAKYEEDNGLVQRSLRLYDKALKNIDLKDKNEVFMIYIAKVLEISDLASARPIYQRAINEVQTVQAVGFCIEFAKLEVKLGEFERSRGILKHGGSLLQPSDNSELWNYWKEFELKNGDESTYRDMLRYQREITTEFSHKVTVNRNDTPIGFVKSSEGPKVTTYSIESSGQIDNPDEIELDM